MTALELEELAGSMFAHYPDCGLEGDADARVLRVLPTGKREDGSWMIPMNLPVADVQRECTIYLAGYHSGRLNAQHVG